MDKELEWSYEIGRTAEFIESNKLRRVALQFPDELLKDSVRIVTALRASLSEQVGLFLMADTAYGSCCVDEVGASHVDADCVVHYGHTCLSPTTKLPSLFVFGKAPITVSHCVTNLLHYAQPTGKPVMVLFGLDYAHSIQQIRESVMAAGGRDYKREVQFADVMCSVMNPLSDPQVSNDIAADGVTSSNSFGTVSGNVYRIGGLVWELPEGSKMEDYLLFWIGSNNSAFANIVLTYSGCEIVRYDASECSMVTDLSQQRRILKRRYYLMEKAKDANIVAILVGTLGVAGYLNMIHQMKELITAAGKKVYTLVMGRPNPAKLANFPECDIFIYVSCAQTALLDSKEYLAPVITPFEAMLAFSRGSQWTGEYVMEFRDLKNSSPVESRNQSEEARFSFIQGGYVEGFDREGRSPVAISLFQRISGKQRILYHLPHLLYYLFVNNFKILEKLNKFDFLHYMCVGRDVLERTSSFSKIIYTTHSLLADLQIHMNPTKDQPTHYIFECFCIKRLLMVLYKRHS